MRKVVRGSLFVALIGVINLGSSIGIPASADVVTDWNNAALDAIRADRQRHRLLLAASRLFTSRSMTL